MPGPRLIVERLPESGGLVRLTRGEAGHVRARRLLPGDAVVLVDGSGAEAEGRVERLGRDGAEVRITAVAPAPSPAGPELRLLVSAVRAERLAWIAEKAAELGAAAVGLVRADRTQGFRARDEIRTRLERIVREAAKQTESARWPAIEGPRALADVLKAETARHRLFLDAEGERFPPELSRGATSLLVGPEGGWTEQERRAALAAGWRSTALPAGKLRTETAAVAALVLARAALGARNSR